MIVDRNRRADAATSRSVENRIQAVRIRFIGAEQAKIFRIEFDHVTKKFTELAGSFGDHLPGGRNFQRVVGEVGKRQGIQKAAAIGMRAGSHAASALGREVLQFGNELAIGVKKLLGMIASHPGFEHAQVRRAFANGGERNLVRAESALDGKPVHFFRARPALRCAQNDHRPNRDFACGIFLAGVGLESREFPDSRRRELPRIAGDVRRVVAFNEIGVVSVAAVELFEFAVRGASLDRGPGNFVAVEMQNRKHGAIAHGIQKPIGLPASFERTGFRLAVAHDAQRR